MIKAYLKDQDRDWDANLGCLAAAYRSTPQESTGLTPNLLMLGREVRLPAEIMFGSGTTHVGEQVTSYGQYVDKLKTALQKSHEVARKHLHSSAKRQKQDYDSKLTHHQYHPGDLVWCLTQSSQLKIAPKLRCPFEGPFLVLERINDLDYVIQTNSKGTKKVIHHNKLKPYLGTQVLDWSQKALKSHTPILAQA